MGLEVQMELFKSGVAVFAKCLRSHSRFPMLAHRWQIRDRADLKMRL
jgi:L-ribulose-5-phosphate 3-epimerase UlaE